MEILDFVLNLEIISSQSPEKTTMPPPRSDEWARTAGPLTAQVFGIPRFSIYS